ncbi:hypothetical protein HGI47_07920 [Novosphingobium sp. ERN07]|uniref:hypothetical protein n=1 Tax=unclassified Novosphingobium TaxID=2644732 RepID=UPI00061CBEA4|nr:MULTISPECIES: hypothetical protein [unclassified Novosphingobium]NLR41047.1 hypothetical protein [Novosphingobium sp. ERW19]NLR70798.1 hypothetical protein [Novosphingobium sp. ERN07]GAO55871.1 hypothetical protein NMD1_03023 [Novosphingobium sp. MD-1]
MGFAGRGAARSGYSQIGDNALAYACNSRNAASIAQSAWIIFLVPASAVEVLLA